MKKNLLSIICLLLFVIQFNSSNAQTRYIDEMFTSVNVTQNVTYGRNVSILLAPQGFIDTIDLKADIYEPVGDVLPARATVIMLHTGSFLPIFYNGQATGIKTDSAVVEMCTRFARKGYTAISIDYRLGWNPQALGAAGQEVRTGTLLQAVYRALQDTKAAVRYFRNDAQNSNTYHVDEQNIILGGLGSGGYIALAYVTLNDPAQIALPKFIAANNNPNYFFTAGQSYIDMSVWGDFDGYGGDTLWNRSSSNTPGVNSNVSFIFNCGGALGDSSWLQSNPPNVTPMVCFHVVNDPFAPYVYGPVIVPTTGDFVVDVSGSHHIMEIADGLHINHYFQDSTWTDPFSVRADLINDGYDGLFPFELPDPPGPATGQAGPWDYFDSTTVYNTCMFGLGFTQGKTDTVWYNSLSTDPDMSKAKEMAYIDTIMGYLCPRVEISLRTVGVPDLTVLKKSLKIYPNPATDYVTIKMMDASSPIQYIKVYDISGRLVQSEENIRLLSTDIDTRNISAGYYILKVGFESGELSQKLSIR